MNGQLTLDAALEADAAGMEQAIERRDQAMELVEANAGEEWRDYARQFVHDYCETHGEVFCDDLWEAGLKPPANRKALGPVMRHAARNGWMTKIGYAPSAASNTSPKALYQSNIHQKDNA